MLATTDDCRRVFDDAGCRSIVARAQVIYAETAPRFPLEEACESVYGVGTCAALRDININLNFFAPALAVIATDRAAQNILPLYFGPRTAASETSRHGERVYYRHGAVGEFLLQNVGGAALPVLCDLAGNTMTAEAIKALRRR